jgi:hypothetical protein
MQPYGCLFIQRKKLEINPGIHPGISKIRTMKKPTSASEKIQKAIACHHEGCTEDALKLLHEVHKRGHGSGKKVIKAILRQIASVSTAEPKQGKRSEYHLPRVLGHLTDSAKQIQTRCHALKSSVAIDDPSREQVMLLDSELNVLIHELDLSIQRGQLQTADQNDDPVASSLDELNEKWLKKIRSRAVSQLGQDLWILEKCSYKRGGFFVEFGATNGIILSNTYLLEKDFGWNGICSEPNPEFLNLLKKNRLCIVSDECIGSSTGEKVEFVFADVFGGMVADIDKDEHREKREAYRASGATTHLTTISLHDFLLKHNAPKTIDYISVDTEGSEFAILGAFPFSEWDVRHITVEHNNTPQRQLIRDLLSRHGYRCQEAQWDDWYYRS